MKNNKLKPLVQESFNIGIAEPDPIVIDGNTANAGILYIPTGLTGFRQDGLPATITKEKNYGTKEEPRKRLIYIKCFYGTYIDEYINTHVFCPFCRSELHQNGTTSVTLRHMPFGDEYTDLEITERRFRCSKPGCPYTYTASPDFKAPNHMITNSLLAYTQDLLKFGFTLKEVAHITGLNKNVVKDIHKDYLMSLYTVNGEGKELKKPEKRAKFLGIDEFKLHNNYKYATVIIDLETGHILHIAHGKKKAVVFEFIDRVGEEWMSSVSAVACDMNSDFEEAFKARCPHISIVYDHFHIVKNFNDKVIKQVRIDEQNRLKEEGREDEAKKLKGTRHILTAKKETLKQRDKDAEEGKTVSKESPLFNKPEVKAVGGQREKYNSLIKDNELFLAIDIVKEKLEEAYNCTLPANMKSQIMDIIDVCRGTENKHFEWFANLLEKHLDGIITHATYRISTGKLEGFNNAIKTERRQGYGYPDDEYFFLRLMDRSRRKDNY